MDFFLLSFVNFQTNESFNNNLKKEIRKTEEELLL